MREAAGLIFSHHWLRQCWGLRCAFSPVLRASNFCIDLAVTIFSTYSCAQPTFLLFDVRDCWFLWFHVVCPKFLKKYLFLPAEIHPFSWSTPLHTGNTSTDKLIIIYVVVYLWTKDRKRVDKDLYSLSEYTGVNLHLGGSVGWRTKWTKWWRGTTSQLQVAGLVSWNPWEIFREVFLSLSSTKKYKVRTGVAWFCGAAQRLRGFVRLKHTQNQ